MKTTAISGVLLASAIGAGAPGGGILYVDDDAPPGGDGASWKTAYRFLQDALAQAPDGAVSEIRVGQGTYRPDQHQAVPDGSGDREASFELITAVSIKGGYLGLSADEGQEPDDRDIASYPTILSGDLLGDDGPDFVNYDENSLHVVTVTGPVADATLDGVTITGGNANGPPGANGGGGVYVAFAEAAVHLVNCTLTANFASAFGGAIRLGNNATPNQSSFQDSMFVGNVSMLSGGAAYIPNADPIMTGCTFAGNTAGSYGGGIYWAPEEATMVGCTFTGNTADEGGGLTAFGGALVMAGCTFSGNDAELCGGGMWAWGGADVLAVECDFSDNTAVFGGGAVVESADLHLLDTTFSDNTADTAGGGVYVASFGDLTSQGGAWIGNDAILGGGLYNDEQDPQLTATTFEANTAMLHGGAIYSVLGSPSLDAVVFTGNDAEHGGGAYLLAGTESFLDCTFEENTAGEEGGGIYALASTPVVLGSLFTENWSHRGAGIYAAIATPTVRDCVFRGNVGTDGVGIFLSESDGLIVGCAFLGNEIAYGGGAGIHNDGSNPVVANCRFVRNGTGYWAFGLGMYNVDSSPTVSNCLFYGQVAVTLGIGLAMYTAGGAPVLSNCILWMNGSSEGAQLVFSESSTPTINYSCIQHLASDWGVGNIGLDPRFVDPLGPDGLPYTIDDNDYHLAPDSPCIDAGDNTAVPDGITLDLDGLPRFVDDPDTPDSGNAGLGDSIVDIGPYEFCRADTNRDGTVDVQDLVVVILAWGTDDAAADTNADGIVDVDDLIAVILNMGPCS